MAVMPKAFECSPPCARAISSGQPSVLVVRVLRVASVTPHSKLSGCASPVRPRCPAPESIALVIRRFEQPLKPSVP